MLKGVGIGRVLVLLLLLVVSVSLYSCGGGDTPSGGSTQNDNGSGDDGNGDDNGSGDDGNGDDDGSGDDIVAKTPAIVSDPSNKAVLSWGDVGTTVTYTFSTTNLPKGSHVGLSSEKSVLFRIHFAGDKQRVDEDTGEVSFTVNVSSYSLSLGATDTLTATVYNGSNFWSDEVMVDGEPLTASIDVQLKEYPAGTAPRISFVHPERYIQYFYQSAGAATSKVNYTIEFENLPPDSVISLSTKDEYSTSYPRIFGKDRSYSKSVSGSGTITLPKSLSSSFKAGYSSTLVASVSARQGISNRTVLDSSGEHLQASVDVVSVKASSIKVLSGCYYSLFLGDKGSTLEYTYELTDIPEGGGFLYLDQGDGSAFEPLSKSEATVKVDGGNSTVTYSLKAKQDLAGLEVGEWFSLSATLYIDSDLQYPYHIKDKNTSSSCWVVLREQPYVRIDNHAQEVPLNKGYLPVTTIWASHIPATAVIRLTTSPNNVIDTLENSKTTKRWYDKSRDLHKYTTSGIPLKKALSVGDTEILTATVYRDEKATMPMLKADGSPASHSIKIRVREIPVQVFSPTSLDKPRDIPSDQTGQVISYEFSVWNVPEGGGYARLDLNPESKIFASASSAEVSKAYGTSKVTLTATTKNTLTAVYDGVEEMTVSLYEDSSFTTPLLDANNFPVVGRVYSRVTTPQANLLASSESNAQSFASIDRYYSPSIPPTYAGKTFQVSFHANVSAGVVVRLTSEDGDNVISKILDEKIVIKENYSGPLSFNISLAGTLTSGSAVQLTATAYENENAEQPMKNTYGNDISRTIALKIEGTRFAISRYSRSRLLIDVYELKYRSSDYSFDVYGVPPTSILELSPLANSDLFPSGTSDQSSLTLVSFLSYYYWAQQGFRTQLNLTRGVILPGDEAELAAKVYSDASKATPVYDDKGQPLEMIVRVKAVGRPSVFVPNPVIEIPIKATSESKYWTFPISTARLDQVDKDAKIRINKQSTSNTLVMEANTFRSNQGMLAARINLNENLKVGDEETLRIAAYGSGSWSNYPLTDEGRNIEILVTIKIVE